MKTKYKIDDLDHYRSEMGKSWRDKLFFLGGEKMWVDGTFLDVGAADGAIDAQLRLLNNSYIVGYDNNPLMIEKARKREIPQSYFSDDWSRILNKCRENGHMGTLFFSSVIHEMPLEDLIKILHDTHEFKPNNIVIRDMYWEGSITPPAEYVVPIQKHPRHEEWRKIRGCGVQTPKEILHFLLTYRFEANYEREVNEDYFSVPWEKIDLMLRVLGYENKLDETYLLPFLKEQIKQDFGFDCLWPTHRRQIWQYGGTNKFELEDSRSEAPLLPLS